MDIDRVVDFEQHPQLISVAFDLEYLHAGSARLVQKISVHAVFDAVTLGRGLNRFEQGIPHRRVVFVVLAAVALFDAGSYHSRIYVRGHFFIQLLRYVILHGLSVGIRERCLVFKALLL